MNTKKLPQPPGCTQEGCASPGACAYNCRFCGFRDVVAGQRRDDIKRGKMQQDERGLWFLPIHHRDPDRDTQRAAAADIGDGHKKKAASV